MLRVFVALGKQMPKDKAMIEDTKEVARLLAKYDCTMVQGGARMGLMGVVVSEFEKYSQEYVMIVPEVHKSDLDNARPKEYYIVEGESDRMRITIHTCDMMVVLPGGSGTLAEIAYYNETCKTGEHDAKVVVINTKGFYNKLFKFHKHQIKSGFMGEDACKYEVISNAKQLEPILQQLITEKQAKLQEENADDQPIIEEAKEVAEVKPTRKTKSSTSKKATSKPAKKEATKAKQPKKTDVKKEGNVAKSEVKSKPVKKATKSSTELEAKPKSTTSKAKKSTKVTSKKEETKEAKSSTTKKAKSTTKIVKSAKNDTNTSKDVKKVAKAKNNSAAKTAKKTTKNK